MNSSAAQGGFLAVGIDETPEALEAVAWATRYAAAAGARVKLVHAIPSVNWMFGAALAFSPAGLAAKLYVHAGEVLDKAEAAAREADDSVPLDRQIIDAEVAEGLAEAADGARLLVIAAGRNTGRIRGAVLGGHVQRTVEQSPVPVLVWRATEAKRTGPPLPVVVGVDESEHADRAVRAAFAAAAVLKAPVQVTHTWETGAAVGLGYGQGPTDWELQTTLKAAQEKAIDELVAPIAGDFPHTRSTEVRADTTPIKGLTEASEQAQLLVVGSRGRGRLAGALLGSVSQAMLHHSRCPVLVVH